MLFELQVDGAAASVTTEEWAAVEKNIKVKFLAHQRVGANSDKGWLALPRNAW